MNTMFFVVAILGFVVGSSLTNVLWLIARQPGGKRSRQPPRYPQ